MRNRLSDDARPRRLPCNRAGDGESSARVAPSCSVRHQFALAGVAFVVSTAVIAERSVPEQIAVHV
jgi:hypothetical protein